ncbi:choice-of-anchor D domain-containing protein [Rhizobacter sp. LjRoot28]|uniref:choice-of-anchor D domain-containing protein n=1 Tax=Rhizobacter sp. LjRoot28 TaxID=3342309 RepID=UPI003ED0B21C
MKTITLKRALSRIALLAMTGAASFPAIAQDAATGEALYKKVFVSGVKSCESCHGTPDIDPGPLSKGSEALRIKGATTAVAQMKALNGAITDAEYNHLAAYLGKWFQKTPTYIAVSAAPSISVSAASLSFASQKVGTSSSAQTLTVTNAASATGPLALSAIGTGAGSDFTVTGGTCSVGAAIAIGASCTVSVAFKPAAVGSRTGTLTLAHNAPGGKTEVALSGQAIDTAPLASLSPSVLSFASVVGSDSQVMRATLSNTGNAPLALSSVAVAGAHAGDFRLANSTTCASGASVAGGSSCVVDVIFKPTTTGARAASVAIAHNAAGGAASVTLNGTGSLTPEPGIVLDANQVDLGAQPVAATSAARTVTLTNTGGAALTLSSLALSGTDAGDFVRGGTCATGTPVASRASCTITVAINPVVLGEKNATLTIASNAPGGAITVALKATAVRSPAPLVGLSTPALGFGTVTLGTTSVTSRVVLTNAGTAPLTVTSIASSSTEYPTTHDCPASLAVGTSCLISVSFKPAAAISTEAVVVTTNALSSPNTIVLTGEGTSQSLSVLAWKETTSALNFSAIVGEASASQTLTLVNKGPAAVTLTTLGIAGASASAYALDAGSTCKLGQALALNATCTVTVKFNPTSVGTHIASLQVASTGTLPGDITLSGKASDKLAPKLSASASVLDFSAPVVSPGSTSAAKALTVTNAGTAPASLTGLQITGPFALQGGTSGACASGASTLAAGASCKVNVVFMPTMAGKATGMLTVGNALTPLMVELKGQSVAASAGVLSANPAQLSFTNPPTAIDQVSAAQVVTISNGAVAPVTIAGTAVSGPFTMSSSTCGSSLAVNASCTVSVTFAPKSASALTGELAVTTGAGQVLEVALVGATPSTGTPGTPGTPTPGDSAVLLSDMASLGFVGALGTPSANEVAVIRNAGTTALTLKDIGTTGPFEVAPGAANACRVAQSLAAGASCEVAVVFRAPMSSGDSSGVLTVTATANGSSTVEKRTVMLNGRSMATNAGGRNEESGGGAADPLSLALLGLGAAALAAGRVRRNRRTHSTH